MFRNWRKISRSVRTGSVSVVFGALALLLPTAPATAELIVTPNDSMGGVGSLLSWSYTTDGMTINLFEDWGEVGPVGLSIFGTSSAQSGSFLFGSSLFGGLGLGGTLIEIKKDVINTTNFDWTDFHIDLIPGDGSDGLIVDPNTVFSDRFSDVMVMNNDDGSASIWYFTDKDAGDTPVLIGQSVSLSFTLNIFGSINFDMRQTPTPAPGAMALLALAGAVSRRRRRN